MKDVMLDLETMGRDSNAPIIAIGAVRFSVEEGLGEEFYATVDLRSSVADGAKIDPDTVIWWMQQSDEARSAFSEPGLSVRQALEDFSLFLPGGARIWGNGAAFDNVILAATYRRAGLDLPWNFWDDRCYRTLKALHPHIRPTRVGTHQNALDDARTQAVHLIEILRGRVA